MIDNNIGWLFAFGFGIALFTFVVKNYIDSKVDGLERRFDATERMMFDEDMAIRNATSKRLDNLQHEIEQNRTNVWREIDTLWERKEAKSDDKAMSKNYYNSEAGTNCCKSAAEYLKG